MIDLNPLEVLYKRKVSSALPHFSKMKIDKNDWYNESRETENWIRSKLTGRYYIETLPYVNKEDSIDYATFVGLEDPKEMTYFALACPHIRRK